MAEIYEEKYEVKGIDVDKNNRWKASSILSNIEVVSSHHNETVHSGRNDLMSLNLAWVIARSKLEVSRYPSMGERITLKTWVGEPVKFIYPRYCVLEDENGFEIAKSITLWSVIDLQKRSVVLAPQGLIKYFNSDKYSLMPLSFPSKLDFDCKDHLSTHKVTYSEIDLNKHANNARYLDWIYDAIDSSILDKTAPKSIQINYIHEVNQNDDVQIGTSLKNDCIQVTGSVNGNIVFQAQLLF